MKASSLFLGTGAVAAFISIITTPMMRAAEAHLLAELPVLFGYFGWPTLLSFGLYYRFSTNYDEHLAQLHYRIEVLGLGVYLAGLYSLLLAYSSFRPFTALCLLIGLASLGFFLWIVLPTANMARPALPERVRREPVAGAGPNGASGSWRQRANIS